MMAGKEIPPTGKSVVGKGTYFARVKGGKVVELNSYPDIAGMMMQLGFMPRCRQLKLDGSLTRARWRSVTHLDSASRREPNSATTASIARCS